MTPSAISISPPRHQDRVNPAPSIRANGGDKGGFDFWGEDGFTFGDLVDLINPLQHVPIVSALYRKITGDAIADGPRLLGGALFGGITGGAGVLLGSIAGFATAAVNSLVEEKTGKDMGEHVLALFYKEKPTIVAAATPPPSRLEIPRFAKNEQEASHLSAPTLPDWTSYAIAAALDKYTQSRGLAMPAGTRVDTEF